MGRTYDPNDAESQVTALIEENARLRKVLEMVDQEFDDPCRVVETVGVWVSLPCRQMVKSALSKTNAEDDEDDWPEITYCDTCTTQDYCADMHWGNPEKQDDLCAQIRRAQVVVVDSSEMPA